MVTPKLKLNTKKLLELYDHVIRYTITEFEIGDNYEQYEVAWTITRMCAHPSIERGIKKSLKKRAYQVLTMHARYFGK